MTSPLLGLVVGHLISSAIRSAAGGNTEWWWHAIVAAIAVAAIASYISEKYRGGRRGR